MSNWYGDFMAKQEYEKEMHQLYSGYKYQSRIWQERAERMKALAASRLELLRQANEWIDELMEQLEGVDMPTGLSDFLDELAEELGDDK